MKRVAVILVFCFMAHHLLAQIAEPVKWSFESTQNGQEATLIFKATIEKGWHLYDTDLEEGGPVKTSIHFADSTLFDLVGKVQKEPLPTKYFDKIFNMNVGYFSNKAALTQKIKLKRSGKVEIKGFVEYMSCNDETCTPPSEADFTFTFNNEGAPSSDAVPATTSNSPKQDSVSVNSVDTAPTIPSNIPNQDQQSHSLAWFLFYSFLAGLAAIMTPCVFPMIPMTVSFFMNSGESKLKARLNAIFYGFSIVVIYTVIGTLVSVIFGPGIANWLSTHWLPNLIFFAVFMLFAFSFFGMFEIVLPSWIVNKSDQQVDKGGLMGSFFMALTLVLVSFSCTGPIVGTILVQSAGGQVLKPIVGMFGFSMAFALPFTLFALFPGWLNNLPKSGGWLNSVKVVLGFLELALGLKFLSVADQTYHWGILDREVYLALWIVIFVLLGFYLLG
ncbi:MAG: cytochrome c biogenesis protein CcdA, partial [Bacteroidales bacterium]